MSRVSDFGPALTSTSTRLSIIVPTWNEVGTLPGLVASLELQDRPFELIVTDGGSPDGTAGLAERLGALVVSGSRGRGAQLARGAEAARGELLFFVHADSRLASGALAKLEEAFEDPRVIATGMRQVIDHRARFYRWVEGAANRRVGLGWVYGDSGLCVRRSAYDAAGGFGALPIFEDLDFSRRLRRLGRIVLVRQAELYVSARRWEEEGRLRRTLKNWWLTLLFTLGVEPERLSRQYPPQG